MNFFKDAGTALLGGWIIGIIFSWIKLPAPVPSLLGLIGAAGVLLGGVCYELFVKFFLKN